MKESWIPEDNADGHGKVTGTCGDTIEIFVKLDDGQVTWAHHRSDGCMVTAACAMAATRLVERQRVGHALRAVRPDAIEALVGELTPDHKHCAVIASHAVHEAIEDAIQMTREPWRKAYRRAN